MENLTALKAELQLKQKELDIISEIDRIRDTMPEPTAMLANIVTVLADDIFFFIASFKQFTD